MKTYNQNQFDEILSELNNGNIVAVPTETVYGLAVKYDDPKAIEKLIELKDRSVGSGKIFTLMVASPYQVEEFAKLSEIAEQIVMNHLPAPLTLILPRLPNFTNYYFDNFDTIGIRVPDHGFMLSLLSKTGPLIVTSANHRGDEPCLTDQDIMNRMPEVDVVISGEAGRQNPSTVAQIIDNKVRILRQGDVSLEDILGGSSCKRFFTLE